MNRCTNETLCFGLDIGTRTVIGIVGYKQDNQFILVDYECQEHEERAMMDGQIHDIPKVAYCVEKVKQALEERLKINLREVAIAAAGRSLSTQVVEVTHEFEEDKEITSRDIHHLELEGVEVAKEQQLGKHKEIEYYCVAYSVIAYYADGYEIANLEEQKSHKIGAKLIATFLPRPVIDSLYAVTERAGLMVSHLTLEPIAAINAVIPEQIRLLNLALVDVGAGTSDIAITRDGSVVAYGMIPNAGDEVTETIVHHYLVDFHMAEKMKKQAALGEPISYTDIIGITHEITSEELKKVMSPIMETLAKEIAEKMIVLNSKVAPNAVFCVGGGSQMVDLGYYIAQYLKLPQERVALRSARHLVGVRDEAGLIDSPQMITPVGICMTMIQNKSNQFTYIEVNDEKVQLLNAKKLTILDAIIASGIEHYQIFPRKGSTLMFKLNGERKRIKGEPGIPAKILHNGVEASIQEFIQDGDHLEIIFAKEGKMPNVQLKEIIGVDKIIKVENQVYTLPLVKVNGHLADRDYAILTNDEIKVIPVENIGQLMDALHITTDNKVVTRQFKPVKREDQLHHGDALLIDTVNLVEDAPMDLQDKTVEKISEEDIHKELMKEGIQEVESLYVIVNDQRIDLPYKNSDYILAGIFDFIDFDLSKPQGTVKLIHNGKPGALTDTLKQGDCLEIYWKK